MKFEYEEFSTIEDLFLYMASIASLHETIITNNPLQRLSFFHCSSITLSTEILMMVYVKTELSTGLFEFDISTGKYKKIQSIERADKNYFIIITPKSDYLSR